MKRSFLNGFLIGLLIFIVTNLLAACNTANATPNYRATFQPEITKTEAGNTLIVTDNFIAVILPADFMDTRSPWVPPVPPSGYWTPKVDQVLALESKLEEFVAQNGSRFNSGRAPSKEELSTYGRQYFGLTNRQGSFIIGTFVCPQSSEKFGWQNHVVAAKGGGDCQFGIWYDIDKQEFISIMANSRE